MKITVIMMVLAMLINVTCMIHDDKLKVKIILIPYFSDYKSTRCISRPLFFSCKMMIFSDTLSVSRLPQSLFFTYNCVNSYKIIDHIKSDKTKSKKLFQYNFNFLLKT